MFPVISVKTLDLVENVDAIVVVNNAKLGQADDAIFASSSRPLIYWGHRPLYTWVQHTVSTLNTKRMCQIANSTAKAEKETEYCITNLAEVSRRNGTVLGKVPLTGAHVIGTLVTKTLHWRAVIVFHENCTEMEATRLVGILSTGGITVVIYNVDTSRDLFSILRVIYDETTMTSSNINVIVLCKFECLRRLFWEVYNFDQDARSGKTLMKQLSRWLVASYDHTNQVAATLRTCAHDIDNVAVLAFPSAQYEYDEQWFDSALRQTVLEFLVDNEPEVDNITFQQHVIERLETLSKATPCEALTIETLMWTHEGRGFSNLGYVSFSGEVVVFSDLFPNTHYGYNKRQFLVSTLHYPPFVKKSIENGTAVYEGMCMDLLKELARTLNFTYILTEPADKKWGSPGPNNTFNGMIGQLQREEVDIVAADISIQKNREMVMDFAFPFYYGDTSVLLKKPDPNARKWRTLVDPFKWQILMAIGILLPVVSLAAFLFEKFHPYYDKHKNSETPKEMYSLNTFHDAFWYMYGALLCQGGVNLPQSVAGRTFVSCWWLFSIVLVGTYCGNLIAFLTVTKDKPPFNTLKEMVDMKNEYTWGTQAGTHWEYVFKTSTIPEFRKVGDLMMQYNESDPSVMATDFDVHLRKVKNGGYGWIGDTVIIEVEMSKDCDLMMIKEKFLPLKYAFGFTNNSPHAKIFSEQMLSIHESGLLHVWKRRWWPKASICSSSIVTEATPISVVDVQSAFYVAAGGAVIGFLSFVLELVTARVQTLRRRHHDRRTKVNEQDRNNDMSKCVME